MGELWKHCVESRVSMGMKEAMKRRKTWFDSCFVVCEGGRVRQPPWTAKLRRKIGRGKSRMLPRTEALRKSGCGPSRRCPASAWSTLTACPRRGTRRRPTRRNGVGTRPSTTTTGETLSYLATAIRPSFPPAQLAQPKQYCWPNKIGLLRETETVHFLPESLSSRSSLTEILSTGSNILVAKSRSLGRSSEMERFEAKNEASSRQVRFYNRVYISYVYVCMFVHLCFCTTAGLKKKNRLLFTTCTVSTVFWWGIIRLEMGFTGKRALRYGYWDLGFVTYVYRPSAPEIWLIFLGLWVSWPLGEGKTT